MSENNCSTKIIYNTRNSNIELLRIISIFMIIVIHFNMYSQEFCQGGLWKINNGLVNGICNIGVSCFILISGFYGITLKPQKLIKLELMVITLSLLQFGLSLVLLPQDGGMADILENLIKACFPFITRKYWFYSCYICLCIFSQYINLLIERLNQKKFERLLLTLLIIFSVIPTIFYFEIMQDNGKGLVQMIMMYLIGRYIALYKKEEKIGVKGLCLFIGLWILNSISHEIPIQFGSVYHHLCKDNSITNIVMAVLLFKIFYGFRIQSASINKVARNIFGVFIMNNFIVELLHELLVHYGFLPLNGALGLGGLLLAELIVFAISLVITELRNLLFGKADNLICDSCDKLINSAHRQGNH